jgi:hypothetical protein
MVTTCAGHGANKVIKEKMQEQEDDKAHKSPVAKNKVSDAAPLDTVLAFQAVQL